MQRGMDMQRVEREIITFQTPEPLLDLSQNPGDIQMIVDSGIFLEVRASELEQRSGGAQPVFL